MYGGVGAFMQSSLQRLPSPFCEVGVAWTLTVGSFSLMLRSRFPPLAVSTQRCENAHIESENRINRKRVEVISIYKTH